jgi:purine-nucleoside phosphorylase
VTGGKKGGLTGGLTESLAAAVRVCCGARSPAAAIVLGSGLGGLVDHVEHRTQISFKDLPGLPHPTVDGHAGSFVHGLLNGREVVVIAGRLHRYEGFSAATTALPVRIAHAMGARVLVLSNAAGGIRPDLTAGTLMLVRDHLNFMWQTPIDSGRPLSDTYDVELGDRLLEIDPALAKGVYAGVLGPSYETPAEIRMLARLGADAVGMSTVPEALTGWSLGMRVVAVSCITNPASGVTSERLSHADVLRVGEQVGRRFQRTISRFVATLTRGG